MISDSLKKRYLKYGVDVDKALSILSKVTLSLHCWQLDDVRGFEDDQSLSGGIAATGNYPYRARNFEELTSDMDVALSLIPGKKKINLHAIYQTGDIVERNKIGIDQFKRWVDYAKERGLGLDFNPTFFSSSMMKDGFTLSSSEDDIRDYWIEHAINCLKISEYFGKELNQKSLCNIWIPDGLKDTPSDRLSPRKRLKDSLDRIFETYKYDKTYMDVSLESKVFGIGLESYTVGSHEFYMNYALKNDLCCLLDTGHFHLGEDVHDKISSLLLFSPTLALHVSRPIRWDSDHVLRLDDNLQEIANELVKCDALDKTYIALDYFDASINRVAALVSGARNFLKAMLISLLTPWPLLADLEKNKDYTKNLVLKEDLKSLPWGEIWDEYCLASDIPLDNDWLNIVLNYEQKEQIKRI